jgi:outer membrane protein insertion porin family
VLGYSLQNYDIYNVSSGVSPEIQAEEGTTTKSMISTSLVWDHRDNPFLTRRGERISVSPFVAGGPLGGDEQTYGLDVQATKYWRVWKDVIFLIDAEASTVDVWDSPDTKGFLANGDVVTGPHKALGVDAMGNPCTLGASGCTPVVEQFTEQISSVPIYDRLYLGGSNNLRGFKFRDISPKDFENEPIGGQSMWRATGEITFPIIEKARGAIFSDVGAVNEGPWTLGVTSIDIPRGPNQIATFKYQVHQAKLGLGPNPGPLTPRRTVDSLGSDFGVGLRLDLPIGPMRLDYGFPIDTAGNAKHGHLNFSVGNQF